MISGIVGAGGNVGGMLFGFLFKSSSVTYVQAFMYIGIIVTIVAALVFITKFGKNKLVAMEEELPLQEVAVA
jgi:NNP family nitrate/nitrite transporter-like MFS transporter